MEQKKEKINKIKATQFKSLDLSEATTVITYGEEQNQIEVNSLILSKLICRSFKSSGIAFKNFSAC